MKKLILLPVAALVALGGVAANEALAGTKQFFNLSINTVTRRAAGDIGNIRNTSDTQQFLSLYIHYSSSLVQLQASGRTTAGVTFLCTSTDPTIIEAAQSAAGDDYVEITWDASNLCTTFAVRTSSAASPKVL